MIAHGLIKLGTVGDWFSGSIALVALGFTMYVWRRDVAATRQEERRRAIADERLQASKVSCWLSFASESSRADDRGAVAVLLHNGTDSPIYQWEVVLFLDPPAREFVFASAELGQIGPNGGRLEIPIDSTDSTFATRSEMQFYFTMADGARWRRERSGELVKDVQAAATPGGIPTQALPRSSNPRIRTDRR